MSIYLDYAATTPVRPEAAAAMTPFLDREFANPSSIHRAGQAARRALEEARRTVAQAIGADEREIVFTSGGTESDNLALRGVIAAYRAKGRLSPEAERVSVPGLIVSSVEHHAVLGCARAMEAGDWSGTRERSGPSAEPATESSRFPLPPETRRSGTRERSGVEYLPVDRDGVVRLEDVERAMGADTVLVSVMLGNNETGALQPVPEIAALAHRAGAVFHTDAVQAVGKVPVNVDALGADLLTLSAHKIGGPKGVGALYVRRGTRIAPMLHGGHQENDLRPGTQNVAGIAGFAKALELAVAEQADFARRVGGLRDRLQAAVMEGLSGVRLNGPSARRLPHILNLAFEGVEGETLLLALDSQGLQVSTGSACASGAPEASHVLQAMGVPAPLARSSLRFSLGRETTADEIERAAALVIETVRRLRR